MSKNEGNQKLKFLKPSDLACGMPPFVPKDHSLIKNLILYLINMPNFFYTYTFIRFRMDIRDNVCPTVPTSAASEEMFVLYENGSLKKLKVNKLNVKK